MCPCESRSCSPGHKCSRRPMAFPRWYWQTRRRRRFKNFFVLANSHYLWNRGGTAVAIGHQHQKISKSWFFGHHLQYRPQHHNAVVVVVVDNVYAMNTIKHQYGFSRFSSFMYYQKVRNDMVSQNSIHLEQKGIFPLLLILHKISLLNLFFRVPVFKSQVLPDLLLLLHIWAASSKTATDNALADEQ